MAYEPFEPGLAKPITFSVHDNKNENLKEKFPKTCRLFLPLLSIDEAIEYLKAAKEHEKFHKEGKVYNRESREQETVKGIYIYGDGWVGKFDDDEFGAFGNINPRKIKIEASETTVDVQANQSELPSDIPF